jgi:hypothetical protein
VKLGSRLSRTVVIIVVFWLLGGALVVPIYDRVTQAIMAPYQSTYLQARDDTNAVSQEVSSIDQQMQAAAEQSGTSVSTSDRLAVAQARLAIDANAVGLINYAIASYALFVGFWVGLLALALAVAIAIAS